MTLSAAPEESDHSVQEQKLNITFADTYPVDPPRSRHPGRNSLTGYLWS